MKHEAKAGIEYCKEGIKHANKAIESYKEAIQSFEAIIDIVDNTPQAERTEEGILIRCGCTDEPPVSKAPVSIPTDPSAWTNYGKVLDGEKVVAGVTEMDGRLYMLTQSQKKVNNVWTNCGELFVSEDVENWTAHKENPVLIEAMDWAGQDNGIPHRVAPRTLIKHEGVYYTYARDRNGKYPGIRASGVFSSTDMVDWQGYDDWFVDVERVISKVPNDLLTDNDYERCYLKCATIHDGIYLVIAIQDVEGNDVSFVFKGTDPTDFDTFEYIESPGGREVDNLYYLDDWIQIGRGDPGFNSIKLQRGWKPFVADGGIPIEHDGPRETIYPIYFRNRWNLFYDDNKNGRNIHLSHT